MNTIGMLLLAAATAGDGFGYSKPGVGFKKLFRPSVVVHGDAPPGGMIGGDPSSYPAANSSRRFPNTKSQIFFLDPDKMKIGWQTSPTGAAEKVYMPGQLTVPARYNFNQGYIYRLKLTEIAGRPDVSLYPTIEVAPSTPATDAYLTHNPIPVQFTAEDFDQVVDGGNFVTKVIYLPDPKFQELAIAGVETLVSTRLEPGVDPILEADKRGTILLIVRLGAIDLEMAAPVAPAGPIMEAAPGPLAPGALPPGVVPTPPPMAPVVPVDSAPVTPAPSQPAVAPVAPAAPPLPATSTPPPPPPGGTTPGADMNLPELPKS